MHAAEVALHLRRVEMHGGRDDVRRHLVAELDDVLAEIGLDRPDLPPASSAAFSPISSEIIDLPLVTVFAPTRLQMVEDRLVAPPRAVRAQCTWPPAAVTFSS